MNNIHILTPDDSHILIHGRHTLATSPITGEKTSAVLYWTGSGVEFNAYARSAQLLLRSDYAAFEQWISVEINGAQTMRVPVPRGSSRLPIMTGRDSGALSSVRVFKDVQPMDSDGDSFLAVEGIELDGTPADPPARKLKIEFIGDSITSGEGLVGPRGAEDWIPMWFSGSLGYPNLVSKELDADFSIISQSGWGLISGYDNNPAHAVPLVYDQVCGVLKSERQRALGTLEPHDFSSWQPDIVVINLGTNDYGAMNNPPYVSDDGARYKQENIPEQLNVFSRRAGDFLAHVRECCPKAHIVWVFGMFPTVLYEAVSEAIERRAAAGDKAVSLCPVGEVKPEELGSRFHPGVPAHKRVAGELVKHIESLMPFVKAGKHEIG